MNLLRRIGNIVLLPMCIGLAEKHSQIIYEGDKVSVMGIITFNPLTGLMEIDETLAVLNKSYG